MRKNKNILKSIFQLNKQGKVMFSSIVMLCMIFITIISVLLGSVITTNKLNLYKSYGIHHAVYYDLNSKQLNDIKNEPSIKDLGIASVAGYSRIEIENNIKKVYIGALNEAFLKYAYIDFVEGSWSQAENEVVLEQRVAESLGVEQLNDLITIIIIKENQKISKQLKVVGIVDDYYDKLHQSSSGSSIRANIPTIILNNNSKLLNDSDTNYSVLALLNNDACSYEESQRISNDLRLKHKSINNRRLYSSMSGPNEGRYSYDIYINEQTIQLAIYLGIFFIVMIISIIIYFTVNISSKKGQISIIRAIGATNKQFARIILARLCPIFLIGIIPSLIIGLILSKPAYTQLKHLTFYNIDFHFVIAPILVLTMLTIFVLVYSMWLYSLRICNVLPKAYKHKKNSRFNFRFSKLRKKNDKPLAVIKKILFSRKRAVLNIVSLSLGISICFITITDINKAHLYGMLRRFNDIEIRISEYHNGDIIELEPAFNIGMGINKDILNDIKKIKGIKQVIPGRLRYVNEYTLALEEAQISEYFSYLKPQYQKSSDRITIEEYESNVKILHQLGLREDMTLFGVNYQSADTFTGCDYDIMHLSKYAEGKVDLEKLRAGEEVILVLPPFIKRQERRLVRHYPLRKTIVKEYKNRKRELQETVLKPGDVITLVRLLADKKQNSYSAKDLCLDQRQVKIGAIIRSNGPFEYPNKSKLFFYQAPNIIIHNDALAKWTGLEQYSRIGIELDGSVDREVVINNATRIVEGANKQIFATLKMDQYKSRITFPSLLIYMPIALCIGFISMLLIYYTVTILFLVLFF